MFIGTCTVLVHIFGASFDGTALDNGGSLIRMSGAAGMKQGGSVIINDAVVHLSSPAAAKSTVAAKYVKTPIAAAVTVEKDNIACRG